MRLSVDVRHPAFTWDRCSNYNMLTARKSCFASIAPGHELFVQGALALAEGDRAVLPGALAAHGFADVELQPRFLRHW